MLSPPPPGELRKVKIVFRCSICGTDVHLWQGSLALKVDLPVILGHEMTGRIVRMGSGADKDSVGGDKSANPQSFTIDVLRCIYCGMCEQACPVDAIELTHEYDIVGLTRQEMIFDKSKLLKIFDETVAKEPM